MISRRGKPLTPEIKKIIVSVRQYSDHNRLKTGEPGVIRTADAPGIGIAAVKRIMADFNRDPAVPDKPAELRGRPVYAVSMTYRESVRSYIRASDRRGEHITLTDITDFFKEQYGESDTDKVTSAGTLNRWGFGFGEGVRSQHLKEKDHVIAAGQRYLREIRSNRVSGKTTDTIRPEVYPDESYVNRNHSNDFIRYYGEDGPWVRKPAGNGERPVISMR